MKCKKIFMISNNNTNESEFVFLESKLNFFTRQEDWFLVRIISNGSRAYRQEKKIPKEVGEKLWRRW